MREDSAAVPIGFGILLLVTLALYTFDPGLAKILAVFDTFGSARLREDIARFGREIEGLGGLTYLGFLEHLEA